MPCRHCDTNTCSRRPGYPYCYGTKPQPEPERTPAERAKRLRRWDAWKNRV